MSGEDEIAAVTPDTPTPGEILQREREKIGITVERAAQDLHLDTWVIEAIETNRFSALGAPVFAKGHMRKYAALLGVPVEEVLRRYESVAAGGDAPTLIPAGHGSVREPSGGISRWAVIGLAVALIGGVAAWWFLGPDARRTPAPVETNEPPSVASPDTSLPGIESGGEIILRPGAGLPAAESPSPEPAADEATPGTGDPADAGAVAEPDGARPAE
ncbi:MAG TPA: helix-turn-helix domain-containing protein [Steroidobacteraceae bacterium]|nr:helix-turn-helix domain-containing protein [Steroidobacteraceae bacterium]